MASWRRPVAVAFWSERGRRHPSTLRLCARRPRKGDAHAQRSDGRQTARGTVYYRRRLRRIPAGPLLFWDRPCGRALWQELCRAIGP
eukprot:1434922-Pyramimonas_sp.AAC.1